MPTDRDERPRGLACLGTDQPNGGLPCTAGAVCIAAGGIERDTECHVDAGRLGAAAAPCGVIACGRCAG